jgi:hypothetical protein
MHCFPNRPARQRGAILVTSLLLLLILTVLGVAMMKMTNMQERMAGNTRDLNLALQGAEAALRDGEERLRALPGYVNPNPNPGCLVCEADVLPINLDDPSVFDWEANGHEFGVAGTDEFREPDVVFLLTENLGRMGEDYAEGADLVMEVMSDDDRRRDIETKRFEYARAGIPEYWLVDPMLRRITVLRLEGDRYAVHSESKPGERAASALLAGFDLDVAAVFAAANG